MTAGKTIALTIQTFVGRVMSLHFNTLSMFVIAFLPRSNCLLISWLQSPSPVILEPHYFKANRKGKGGSSDSFPLLGLQNHCRLWLQPRNQKTISSWQESDGKPRQCVEKQRYYSADKGLYSQGYGLPSGHYSCDSWTAKKAEHQSVDAFGLWCWRRLLKVPWTARRSNQSILRVINPEYSAEAPVFWSSEVHRWLTGKVPDAWEDWGQKEKGMTEDEMVGWHHQRNEHELGQTPGDGEGQGGLACCSPWSHKE